jgi:hypothetical protein
MRWAPVSITAWLPYRPVTACGTLRAGLCALQACYVTLNKCAIGPRQDDRANKRGTLPGIYAAMLDKRLHHVLHDSLHGISYELSIRRGELAGRKSCL